MAIRGVIRRGALLVGVVLLLATSTLAVPMAHADDDVDYVRITIDVPTDGSVVSVSWDVTVLHFGPAPLIAGHAIGLRNGPYHGGVTTAHRLQPGGGVSASAFGARIAWAPVGTRWQIGTQSPVSVYPVDDDGLLEIIVFVPGAESIDVNAVDVDAPAGTTSTVATGRGAHVVAVGDPDDANGPVTVNGIAVGSSHVTRSVDEGITGAIVTGACTSCAGTWKSPDEASTWDWHLPGQANGWDNRQHFKGPAGDWEWTWQGSYTHVTDGLPVYAAYVDVGDDWQNF